MNELQEFHLYNVKPIKKTRSGKEASVSLQTTLNVSLQNVHETRLKNFEVKKAAKAIWKVERPKSASFLNDAFLPKTDSKKLFKSLEFSQQPTFLEKIRQSSAEKIYQKKHLEGKEVCYCGCWRKQGHEWTSLPGLDLLSSSGCGSDTLRTGLDESWTRFNHSSQLLRKCRSNSASSKTTHKKNFDSEKEFHKVKRSLRLLGFELSDFGIRTAWMEKIPMKKPEKKPPSLITKITRRSVSLDSLRATVKRAWMDNRLDESHRRLLAQAAYEEWYFRKESELCMKRNEERLTRLKADENLRKDFDEKKEKSQNEFRKWLQRKRMKRKKTLEESTFNKQTKTKEESDKAFRSWKKKKEEELQNMEKEKKKEEERRLQSEIEKNNRKKNAEKVFELWKNKLKETKMQEEIKRQKQKKKQELQEREKKDEGNHISFEKWKIIKDKQMREKIKQTRLACKAAREKRLEQMEERIHEAEQAFEDWLEKVDLRKQKQCSEVNTYNKIIPWIPA